MDLNKIEHIIRPLVEKSGFTLYDVEFQGRTLRVCIEKEGGDSPGVSIEDCVEISRLLNPVLDVEDVIPGGRYDLEVSSPGLDRELRKPAHFQSVVGKIIHVLTNEPMSNWNKVVSENDKFFEKRKKIKGELKNVLENEIELQCDGRSVKIPLVNITRSYVDFELVKQPKKGAKGKV